MLNKIKLRKFVKYALTICATLILIHLMMLLSGSSAVYIPMQIYYVFHPDESIYCYNINENSLKDISDVTPKKGRSIFFHETSCNSYQSAKIVIKARQACAVESAAKLNPNFQIYLLFTSPGILKFEGTRSDRIIQALLSYENVHILHLDYTRYVKNTPVESLYENGQLKYSAYARSHASDVLRYLTMYKYGGIYLDLDVIVIKSLEDLHENFAGAESQNNVAAGVLRFNPSGIGHEYAKMCLDDLKDNFYGRDWGYNGPGVVTRLSKKLCQADTAEDMINKYCKEFKVYPREKFYAIPWQNWSMFFNEADTEKVNELTKNSYVIHVWNKHSVGNRIPLKSTVPYTLFAEKYCPKVYRQCDIYF